jgi:transposase
MSVRTARTAEEWQRLLVDYHTSGEPAGLFCQRHKIHTTTLYYWLRKEGAPNKPTPRLLPVVERGALPLDAVEVTLPNGITLRFSAGAAAGYVASIVKGIG